MSKRQKDILAIAGLVCLVLAFFWPLLSGRYSIPRGGGDLVSFLWPTWRFAANSLRRGIIPLWNPTLYSGAPFAADNQSALFYPVNLLLFLVAGEPSYAMMEGLVVFHMALAAVLMYLLLRDHGLSRPAAVFGGLAFGLSDVFVTHIGNLNLNATIAYLPGVILLADRGLTRGARGWAAAGGALFAVAALAGHGQMLLVLGLALGILVAYRLALACRRGPAAAARVLGLAGIVALVGLGGAAVALYPNYELIGRTGRAALSLEEASHYSITWAALVGILAPGFYGRGVQAFWGPWNRVEVGYLGVLPVALACAGLAAWRRRLGNSLPVPFFVLVALAGLILALGNCTPVYRLVHGLPLFRSLGASARFVVLTDFALAALAAYGLDHLRSSRSAPWGAAALLVAGLGLALALPRMVPPPPDRLNAARQGVILAVLLSGISLVWLGAAVRWPGARWSKGAAVLILAADLLLTGSTVEIDRGDPNQGFRHDDVVARLQSEGGIFRIDSSAASAWQPDTAAVYGLYDIGGVYNPLGVAAYSTYRWSIAARGDPLYNLLGVKYVLSDKNNPPGDQRLVPIYTSGPDVDIYLNTVAYPMAQLVYHAVQAESVPAAFAAIHAPGFDPTEQVVLLEKPQPVEPAGDRPRHVSIVQYSANRISLEVTTPTPCYLLLSEVYDPGWRASIDGRPSRVVLADYLFRAIYVEPGTHRVSLWFSPPSFWIGLGLSVTTWLVLAAWSVSAWRLRRRTMAGARSPVSSPERA